MLGTDLMVIKNSIVKVNGSIGKIDDIDRSKKLTHTDVTTNITIATDQIKFVEVAFIMKYLHGHWEITLGFRWEEDVDGFLNKWLISCWRSSYFNNVQLKKKHWKC